MTDPRPEPYPGYDVLSKRNGPSWDEATRRVVEARLSVSDDPRFLDADAFAVLDAVCGRIVPQPAGRLGAVPLAAMVDRKLAADEGDGYRDGRLPPLRDAWCRGLAGLDAAAQDAHGRGFAALAEEEQDAVLRRAERGELEGAAWDGMPCAVFFAKRVLHDVVSAYYTHPTAWSEIGYGGPASPRGYVRMALDRRDPWEAAETAPRREAQTTRINARVR